MTSDPPIWIGRGSTNDPDWFRWVFLEDHFTWYRPVAALSFTLNDAVGGLRPWIYRATDLGLHLLAGWLVMRLAARLEGRRNSWMPVLAAALFLVHPGVEEVVPFMARRSYSLATVLGLLALCLVARRPEAPRLDRRALVRTVVAGALLAAAFASNESAAVLVPVAMALFLQRTHSSEWGLRGQAIACLSLVAPFAGALVLRTSVLDAVGGYAEPESTTSLVENLNALAADWIGWSGWIDGSSGSWMASAGIALVFVMLACTSSKSNRFESIWLSAWMAGYALLFLWYGSWVSRQIYPFLAPLALAVAIVLARAVEQRKQRPLTSWAAFVVLIPLVLGLLGASPTIRGQDSERLENWSVRQRVLTRLEEGLRDLGGPAAVHLVLPDLRGGFRVAPRDGDLLVHQSMRHPFLWSLVLAGGRDLVLSDWVYYDGVNGAPTLRTPSEDASAEALEIRPAGRYLLRHDSRFESTPEWRAWTPGFARRTKKAPRRLPLRELERSKEGPTYVLIVSEDGAVLHRLAGR